MQLVATIESQEGGVPDQTDGGLLVMVLALSMGGSGGKATLTRRGVNSVIITAIMVK
jgi:hypothetical protein|tara:strand:+ start:2237 stop:2407 length:171 start_codon:yes stop_codon:yes gene_type:complete